MEAAGLVIDKDGIEALIRTNPQQFDDLTDQLFNVIDPDFHAMMISSTCD